MVQELSSVFDRKELRLIRQGLESLSSSIRANKKIVVDGGWSEKFASLVECYDEDLHIIEKLKKDFRDF
ncbi:MAG: hypothetical protein ACOYKE_02525 [Ferruginibacter sp.]